MHSQVLLRSQHYERTQLLTFLHFSDEFLKEEGGRLKVSIFDWLKLWASCTRRPHQSLHESCIFYGSVIKQTSGIFCRKFIKP